MAPDPFANLLACDGTVLYHGPVLPAADADRYFDLLGRTVPWQHDEVVMFGRRITTAREVAWYGDEGCAYTYSGATKLPLAWAPGLLELKTLVEEITGSVFNSCLLNRYPSGAEGMGWHSDDEKSLVRDACIASVSLGAARKFVFKHKRQPLKTELVLEHGSLLEMKGATQTYWLHRLPPSKKITAPRINLTFRTMGGR
jgi:alkylated DNA repair dioxygenase AlkB